MDGFGFAGDQDAAVKAEADCFLGITVGEVFDKVADGNLDSEFFADFADEAGLEGFAGFDFAAGKLPKIRQMIVSAPLGDQKFTALENQRGGDIDDSRIIGQSICR